MKTWMAKPNEVKADWWLVDASDLKLGRMASEIANRLTGKSKPTYTPHTDTGDFVVVINANKIDMSGKKWEQKTYFRRSRYFGSIKETRADKMKDTDPTFIIQEAVRLMLPRNVLSDKIIKKLKVFTGPTHNLAAQKPKPLTLKTKE